MSKAGNKVRLRQNFLTPIIGPVKRKPFAVFDIETTTDLEKAFLVGFYDGQEYKRFDVYNSDKDESTPYFPESREGCISQFLTWLFSSKQYTKYWLYAHNGGNFDFLYLIRWLMDHGEEFSIEAIPIQSSILSITVRRKDDRQGKWKWTFLDSFRLMNASLEKLGQALVGEGKVRDIDYETLHQNSVRYDYLKQDCILLYKCLDRFYDIIINSGGEIGMTAPSTAMKSFRRMHLTKWIPINRCFPNCDCSKDDELETE